MASRKPLVFFFFRRHKIRTSVRNGSKTFTFRFFHISFCQSIGNFENIHFQQYFFHLTPCLYHVTVKRFSESTLYNCLNIKEFLFRNGRGTWNLNDWSGTRALVHKHYSTIFAKLAKWLRDVASTYAGYEITVERRTCPTNLSQRPIEKRFFLLNVRTMSVENVFVVKP